MITNPSTLGLFEARIGELLEAVHAAGALAYMDGANLNAILGRFKPGEAGLRRHALQRPQDVLARRTAAAARVPARSGWGRRSCRTCPSHGSCATTTARSASSGPGERPTSIGRLRSFVGNTGVLVRAYAYIRAHGGSGLREVSDDAVLAANYLKHRLAGAYDIPYDRPCKHEFVASAASIKKRTGVRTLDIAKRLIDHGFHPPTIYFPLIVEEGMLIEPTETESVETLDAFADALIAIAAEAETDPEQRHGRAAHRPGPAPRRGDGGPPAEPALAPDDRRPDALPGLSAPPPAIRTHVRIGQVDSPSGAVDSTGSAPTHTCCRPGSPRPHRVGRLDRDRVRAPRGPWMLRVGRKLGEWGHLYPPEDS